MVSKSRICDGPKYEYNYASNFDEGYDMGAD